jgi:hypothetical protein
MDLHPFKLIVVLASWAVGAWLAVRVWKSADPVALKTVLTLLALVPIIGPLVVYWISNFPSRLHPDSQAKYRETVNVYGPWKTEDDNVPPERSSQESNLNRS